MKKLLPLILAVASVAIAVPGLVNNYKGGDELIMHTVKSSNELGIMGD